MKGLKPKKNRLPEGRAKMETRIEVLDRFVRGFVELFCKYIVIIKSEHRRKIESIQNEYELEKKKVSFLSYSDFLTI